MMKKSLSILLTMITLFTLATTTYASTTFFLGKSMEGRDRLEINQNKTSIGDTDTTVINLTYAKIIKFSVEYEFGEYEINDESHSRYIWDIQAGYPLVSNQNGFLYITLGGFNYSLDGDNLSQKFNYETDPGMLGFDLVGTPTEKFNFELALQYSFFGGTYHLDKEDYANPSASFNLDLPLKLTVAKLKVQYILTDNLGIVMNHRFIHFDADGHVSNNYYSISQKVRSTSVGLIYRF